MNLFFVIAAGVGVGCAAGVSIGIAAAPYVASVLPYIAGLAVVLLVLTAVGVLVNALFRFASEARRLATPYLPWVVAIGFTAIFILSIWYQQNRPQVLANKEPKGIPVDELIKRGAVRIDKGIPIDEFIKGGGRISPASAAPQSK